MAVWTKIDDFGLPEDTGIECLWASDDEFIVACSLDNEESDCFTNPRSALYGATRWVPVQDVLDDLDTVTKESARMAAVIAAIDAGDDE